MAKIMIVDDSTYFRLKLKEILEGAGHEIVAEAGNGMQALLGFGQANPDIVTMDISMPNVDGIESVMRILNNYPRAKIIMVSAMGQKQFVLDALKLGAKHFVVKPLEKDILLNVVDKVLKG